MCGISGFNWNDKDKIESMVSSLNYRGPDAHGIFTGDGVSLGHNRLSIIDLSKEANQPMSDNGGNLVIIYNGEIYNFKELKKELAQEYSFKTESDTEVILAGYKKWGKGVVDKLNGMFAFAIWDKNDKSLFCARDSFGMKPFYYYWDGDKFIFASEISAIFKHDIPRELNIQAFNHYFRILYTPEPLTMVNNVFKLPPAHTLFLKDRKISIEEYGNKNIPQSGLSYSETVDVLHSKVSESVNRHLVSDVPVGVYLSGGIDSSIVLSAVSKIRKDIETFTIGFNLDGIDEELKFNHDLNLAKRTSEFFGSKHYPLIVSTKDIINAFEEVSLHNSDPISNPTSLPMFLLAKFAKTKVTVALTGNAGDELFGGYDRYRMALGAHYYKQLPQFLRFIGNKHPRLAKLDYKNELDLFSQFMFEKDPKLSRVISPKSLMPSSQVKEYYKKYFTGTDVVDALMNTDRQSWLPDHFFMLSDKMSMASALEERMPFADKELFEFSKSIPRNYKVDLFRTKKVLKDAFKNDLPSFLFDQPKRGWFSPGAKWLRDEEFAKFAREVLSRDYYSPTQELFNWVELQKMLNDHIEKKEYNLTIIWATLTFQVWAKSYKINL